MGEYTNHHTPNCPHAHDHDGWTLVERRRITPVVLTGDDDERKTCDQVEQTLVCRSCRVGIRRVLIERETHVSSPRMLGLDLPRQKLAGCVVQPVSLMLGEPDVWHVIREGLLVGAVSRFTTKRGATRFEAVAYGPDTALFTPAWTPLNQRPAVRHRTDAPLPTLSSAVEWIAEHHPTPRAGGES